jgi:hypothetical protein
VRRYAVRFGPDRYLGMDDKGPMSTGHGVQMPRRRASLFGTVDEAVSAHSFWRGVDARLGIEVIPKRGRIESVKHCLRNDYCQLGPGHEAGCWYP